MVDVERIVRPLRPVGPSSIKSILPCHMLESMEIYNIYERLKSQETYGNHEGA